MNELESARNTISELDSQIAKLFEKRMEASAIVAEYKRTHGLNILDTSRENEVISKNIKNINDPVIKEYYVDFLKKTMELSRNYQARLNEGMRVAYCGVEGAYAHIASKNMFPQAKFIAYKSFEEAYKATENGECDVSVLPIENSYAGDVETVMDLIFRGSLYANQIFDLEIDHCLIANKGASLSSIKRVASHPQALAQCEEFIHLHSLEAQSFSNTALASKMVKDSGSLELGAIASEETARILDLEVLQRRINTSRTNTTRFVALSRALNKLDSSKRKMNEHFILVFTVKNEAGALAKTIDIIGSHGFNMRSLRSRPMKELLWNYYFFVEADGNLQTKEGETMLSELDKSCDRLKVVGSYLTK